MNSTKNTVYMAMVDEVYWQPTGRPVAQASWLCLKVGAGTWHRFCIHRMNRVNSYSGSAMMTAL